MEKDKRGVKRRSRKLEIFLIIFIAILAVIAIYLTFFYVEGCKSFECFKTAMEKCKKVIYINEDPEASWRYEIKGSKGDTCEVEVELILAKRGELEIDKLVGKKMDCFYPEGSATYPENDLTACHGRLKEDLQEIIIKKLHSYIIENLGQIDESIKNA